MLIKVLKSKIHRATVTGLDPEYEGSITIDTVLMDAAGLLPHESVHVWNIRNGGRLETYALPGPRNSGEVSLNGAAARSAEPGDLIIIAAFAWTEKREAEKIVPAIV